MDDGIDCVARGAGDIAHDGALLVRQRIGERGLARIGTADDGDVDRVGVVFLLALRNGAQDIHQLVEQIAGPMAMGGRDGPGVAQAQAVEFVDVVHIAGIVHLVDDQQHRRLALAQDAGDFFVVGVDAGLAIDQEQDDIAFLGRSEGLVADGALEAVVIAHFDTASIDEGEVHAVPVGFVVRTVARDTAHFVHDRVVSLRDSVHEGGFTDIGTTNDGNDMLWHCVFPLCIEQIAYLH